MTSSSSTSGHGPAADVARTCPNHEQVDCLVTLPKIRSQWHVPLAERLDRSFRASSLSASSTPFSCRRTLSLMKRGSVSSRLICWHSASVRTPPSRVLRRAPNPGRRRRAPHVGVGTILRAALVVASRAIRCAVQIARVPAPGYIRRRRVIALTCVLSDAPHERVPSHRAPGSWQAR